MKLAVLPEAIGQAIARVRAEVEQKFQQQIETLRLETKAAIAEARVNDCDKVIRRLDALLLRLGPGGRLADGDGAEVLRH